MRVMWTGEEMNAVTQEGVRLWRAGEVTGTLAALRAAQAVLPEDRRRSVKSTGHVPWFLKALKAAEAPKRPQKPESLAGGGGQKVANGGAKGPLNASKTDAGRHRKVFWTFDEKAAVCREAARLLMNLEAGGPRDALEKAQPLALPPERRRTVTSMTGFADWYPAGLQAARQALQQQAEAVAAEKVAAAEKAAAALAAEKAAAAAAAEQQQRAPIPAPEPEAVEVAPAAQPMMPALAPATPSLPLAMFGDWSRLREHLVQEIASLVAEGIQRGLASVQLTAPAAPAPEDDKPAPGPHVPFVVDGRKKERLPSVLVVGLKGSQVTHIQADFGSKLDLRFCGADKSKDQLRSMTEQADMTVAFTDFLSHSHTDIIKARATRYVETGGGMTHLRQELARIAGLHFNGSAAH